MSLWNDKESRQSSNYLEQAKACNEQPRGWVPNIWKDIKADKVETATGREITIPVLDDPVLDHHLDGETAELTKHLKSMAFRGTFVPDPDQGDFERRIGQWRQLYSSDMPIVFRFPLALWRRVALWLIGVRPFPPKNREIRGHLMDLDASGETTDEDGRPGYYEVRPGVYNYAPDWKEPGSLGPACRDCNFDIIGGEDFYIEGDDWIHVSCPRSLQQTRSLINDLVAEIEHPTTWKDEGDTK